MKMRLRSIYALALLLVLPVMLGGMAGCDERSAGAPPESPREVAATVLDSYAVMQSIASAALESDKLNPSSEAKVKLATQVATEAVLKLSGAAKLCVRVETGKDDKGNTTYAVVDDPANPPGKHCEPSTIGQLKGSAISLIGDAEKILDLLGFKKES